MTGAIQVVIVEDDVRIAEINRRFVEKIDSFEVIGIATDETQARMLLDVYSPELVLLDMYFPDANGLDILRWIRQEHRNTDVIMITAAREVESLRESMRGGVYDFIVKPVIFDRLKVSLENFKKLRGSMSKTIEQADIDQLLRPGGQGIVQQSINGSSLTLPKGIDRLTLEKVLQVMYQTPLPLTAEEVGSQIGASRSTARRYLEYLVSTNTVIADLVYGAVGRPERKYCRTPHEGGIL